MTAVYIPTGSEAEWLEARRRGVTASEIAIVMGLSPYSSPYALYHQKLGTIPAPEQDDAMQLGTYMEQYVAARFAERHPEFQVWGNGRQLFAHPDRPWQMATPDRCLHEYYRAPDGAELAYPEVVALLETKIDGGSDEWGEEGSDEVPVHYRAQALWQMDVMGVSTVYVAVLIWHRRQVRVYEITLDDDARADLKLMRSEAREFLDRIDTKDEPDVDWRPATLDALRTLHPDVEDESVCVPDQLARWYHAACRNVKHWEQRKRLYEARIRQQMGSARRAYTAIGSEPVARRDVYEVREHVRKAHTVDKLVPTPPKPEKEAKTS